MPNTNGTQSAVDVNVVDVNINNDNQHDRYGRDAAERLVELSPEEAEAVNQEVVAGKHQTFDDAKSYIMRRGLAEIKRQRDAQREVALKTLIKAKRDNYANLMKTNPSLITNSEFVNTMLKDLGLTPQASPSK
jgi:hypothetical protein